MSSAFERVRVPPVRMRIDSPADVSAGRKAIQAMAREAGFSTAIQVQIATATSEIMRNAIMYAGGGELNARVTVRALRIEVWDQGPGIPLEILEQIESGTYQSRTGLGKGIKGAEKLMDTFSLMSFPGNTQVVMEMRL